MIRPESKSGSPTRRPATLSAKLNKGLMSYVAAAGAAGAGMLAGTHPAEAEVVYTPANTPILIGIPVALDLNSDGTTDFTFSNKFMEHHSSGCDGGDCTYHATLKVNPAQAGNAGWAVSSAVNLRHGHVRDKQKGGKKVEVAIPGPWGVYIVAPERKLVASNLVIDSYQWRRQGGFSQHSTTQSVGAWDKGKRYAGPYLGLKFMINGEIHYGWARLEVHANTHTITATLTGYAYETVPNRGIVTGLTSGPLDAAVDLNLAPLQKTAPLGEASLGRLAQGAEGARAWRKSKTFAQNAAFSSAN